MGSNSPVRVKFAHPSDSFRHRSIPLRLILICLPCLICRPSRLRRPFEESPLSSDTPAGIPERPPAVRHALRGHAGSALFPQAIPSGPGSPFRSGSLPGLAAFNTMPAPAAEELLLDCCGSHRWARRVAAHRPYPDLESLLAGCDEAGYDLTPADVHEALAHERSALAPGAPPAAQTALAAAHAAYESRFGHAFVICLDAYRPEEWLDRVLDGIRRRLAHDPDKERSVSADELRALARSRLAHAMAHPPGGGPGGRGQ